MLVSGIRDPVMVARVYSLKGKAKSVSWIWLEIELKHVVCKDSKSEETTLEFEEPSKSLKN